MVDGMLEPTIIPLRLPCFKGTRAPFRLPGNRIRLGGVQYPVAVEVQDDEEGHLWRLIGLLDGSRTLSEIENQFWAGNPPKEGINVQKLIQAFAQRGLLEDASPPPSSVLTDADLVRYDRNIKFFSWADSSSCVVPRLRQEFLKKASVTILGIGGVGSAVATCLAASGVGRIHCVDFDTVESSNLNRQVLYTEEDIGRPKVECAVRNLRKLNSLITVTGENRQVTSFEEIRDFMHNSDLFVCAADYPDAMPAMWTNEAALATHKPWMQAGYDGPMLVSSILVPFKTPCLLCILHCIDSERVSKWGASARDELAQHRRAQAAATPITNLCGHLAGLEAIYFLTGLKPKTMGRILHLNFLEYDHVFYVEAPFWNDCPACGIHGKYRSKLPVQ